MEDEVLEISNIELNKINPSLKCGLCLKVMDETNSYKLSCGHSVCIEHDGCTVRNSQNQRSNNREYKKGIMICPVAGCKNKNKEEIIPLCCITNKIARGVDYKYTCGHYKRNDLIIKGHDSDKCPIKTCNGVIMLNEQKDFVLSEPIDIEKDSIPNGNSTTTQIIDLSNEFSSINQNLQQPQSNSENFLEIGEYNRIIRSYIDRLLALGVGSIDVRKKANKPKKPTKPKLCSKCKKPIKGHKYPLIGKKEDGTLTRIIKCPE